jgi:hypothetical protein
MRDWVDTNDEILDCQSISISWGPVGLANVSFKVYRKDEPFVVGGPGYDMCLGGQRFIGVILGQTIVPNRNYRETKEWAVRALARSCPEDCLPPEDC